jgi:hypothetical protein
MVSFKQARRRNASPRARFAVVCKLPERGGNGLATSRMRTRSTAGRLLRVSFFGRAAGASAAGLDSLASLPSLSGLGWKEIRICWLSNSTVLARASMRTAKKLLVVFSLSSSKTVLPLRFSMAVTLTSGWTFI